MADVHNRTRYNQGCRCELCRAAQREYDRDRRAGKTAKPAPQPTTTKGGAKLKTTETESKIPYKESVTAAVKAELETYVGADTRPALAAMALTLARVLDTPSALPQHAAAVGKLEALLTTIAKYGVKQVSKLDEMRADLRSVDRSA